MSRTTRRAATILAGTAVVLSSFSVAQAQTLAENIATAQQGIQVANQGAQLANQFSSLSSSSDTGRTTAPAKPSTPANPVGGKFLNGSNNKAMINGREYQFSTVTTTYSSTSPTFFWRLDEPFTRFTATVGFDDTKAPTGYRAKGVVRADGVIVQEFTFTPGSPHNINVRINRPSELRVDMTVTNHAGEHGYSSAVAVGSPKVYY